MPERGRNDSRFADAREADAVRSMAHHELGWRPRLPGQAVLVLTADWYADFLRGDTDMRAVSRDRIGAYSALPHGSREEALLCA